VRLARLGEFDLTRLDKILGGIDLKTARGVEIGPLMSPVVTRDMGDISYIDRATNEELARWFSVDPKVDVSKITPIDYVWGDLTLEQCVGTGNKFDYCVACHVLEHVPDLIGWLQEVGSILKEGAILTLVLPDMRYTFDCLRTVSTNVDVVDAHLQGLRKPSARQVFDHFSHFVDVDAAALWNGTIDKATLNPDNSALNVFNTCLEIRKTGEYVDSHCWVFTPDSFLKILVDISILNLCHFEVVKFHRTEENSIEFFVSLRKLPPDLTAEAKAGRLRASATDQLSRAPSPDQEHRGADDPQTIETNKKLAAMEAQILALRQSTSWRVTAPLRSVSAVARRLWKK
jgi:hypothetical protein